MKQKFMTISLIVNFLIAALYGNAYAAQQINIASPNMSSKNEAAIQEQQLVLARVELGNTSREAIQDALPTYAWLQDTNGNEYALVAATSLTLDVAGFAYKTLESIPASMGEYIVGIERRIGVRQLAAEWNILVYDDGRNLILRATLAQSEVLSEAGLSFRRLSEKPMMNQAMPGESTNIQVSPPAAVNPYIASLIAKVSQTNINTHVSELSGVVSPLIGGLSYKITTRNTRSGVPIQKATQFIYEHFQSWGLLTTYQAWSSGGYSGRNVIGQKTGSTKPLEIILVTAHLDDMPSSGVAPGADDNASGTTGVLETALIMSQTKPARTVRFVIFTGEEQGLLGSDYYADGIKTAGENVVAAYNMDMISWDSNNDGHLELHTRLTSSTGYAADLAIANTFVSIVNLYGLSGKLVPSILKDEVDYSDHASFWYYGYPAILGIEDDNGDWNDYYHTANDKLVSINLTYLTNYIKASVGTTAQLAQVATIPAPAAVVLQSPANGAVLSNWNPIFTWKVTANATNYYLLVNDLLAKAYIQQWYTLSGAHCNSVSCWATSPKTLSKGPYRWYVKARNSGVDGPLGSGFSLNTPSVPGKVSLISPTSVTTTTPPFRWNSTSRAIRYLLSVKVVGGSTTSIWLTSTTAGCASGGVCNYSYTQPFARGVYTWSITAWNPSGSGIQSNPLNITIR